MKRKISILSMTTLLSIILTSIFFLSSCEGLCITYEIDFDPRPFEDMVEKADYIVIVKSMGSIETIQDYYYSYEIPMTIFEVEMVYTYKGNPGDSLDVSLVGGYDERGRFYGIGNGGYSNCDLEYNLLEDDVYYIMIVEENDGYLHVSHRSALEGYDQTLLPTEQNEDIMDSLYIYYLLENE